MSVNEVQVCVPRGVAQQREQRAAGRIDAGEMRRVGGNADAVEDNVAPARRTTFQDERGSRFRNGEAFSRFVERTTGLTRRQRARRGA